MDMLHPKQMCKKSSAPVPFLPGCGGMTFTRVMFPYGANTLRRSTSTVGPPAAAVCLVHPTGFALGYRGETFQLTKVGSTNFDNVNIFPLKIIPKNTIV